MATYTSQMSCTPSPGLREKGIGMASFPST